jgi:ADP-ribose pyrophosphatase
MKRDIQVHERRLIHTGRIFDIYTETLSADSGKPFQLDIIRHPGAAAIVPVTAEGEIVLLSQYRHAAGGTIWEIPAGTLEDGEAPEQCARRELTEETGFIAQSWTRLGSILPLPAYSDERIHLFLARDLTPARQALDADEILAVHTFAFEVVFEMVRDGRIEDAKSICALSLAAPHFGAWPH